MMIYRFLQRLRGKILLARRNIALFLATPVLKNNTFGADGFTTTHFLGFREDVKFNSAFECSTMNIPDGILGPSPNIEWRAHICTWAANQAMGIQGDFVECGVNYGALSKTICEYVDFKGTGRTFYLIDTWGAFPGSHKNYQVDIFDRVEARFSM